MYKSTEIILPDRVMQATEEVCSTVKFSGSPKDKFMILAHAP